MNKTKLLIASLCATALFFTASREAAASCPSLSLKCFYVRSVGILYLSPALAQPDEVELQNVEGPAALVIAEGPIPGSSSGVAPLAIPALSAGMIIRDWGTKTLSLEVVLAPPNMVEIEMTAEGSLATESLAPFALGSIPTGVPPAGHELGVIRALPPMLTAVYRPMAQKRIQPYVGAGLAYMIILGGEITNPLLTSVNPDPLLVGDHGLGNLGVVAQAGAELRVATVKGKNIFVNADVKFIGFLEVTATVKDVYVEAPEMPLFGAVKVGDASASVTVNPLVFQLGAGMDF